MALFSIGHSTLTIEAFARICKRAEVDLVLDIRSHPTSKWEWWRIEQARDLLAEQGLEYRWWPELGGWTANVVSDLSPEQREQLDRAEVDLDPYVHGKFPKHHIAKSLESTEGPSWTSVGLRDYAWFLTLPSALEAIDGLIDIGRDRNAAFFCAEGRWWLCHRSMVCDVLVFAGSDARHLPGRKTHREVLSDRLVRYDSSILETWDARWPHNAWKHLLR